MYVQSNAKNSELTQLREQNKEIEQLRADAAESQEKAQLSDDQVVVSRKDKEELIRLRGEVGKLRLENQKFTKDVATLQSHAAPRTPDASPWAGATRRVRTSSENTCAPQREGTAEYRRDRRDKPPPRTMTSGSSTLITEASARARRAS